MDRRTKVLRRWTVLLLVLAACQSRVEPDNPRQYFAGDYELVVTSGYESSASWPEWERLVLRIDGTYSQSFALKTDEVLEFDDGTWSYKDRRMHLDTWRDSAGLWRSDPGEALGAHLIVELSEPPLILLHPDLNVFYEKVE